MNAKDFLKQLQKINVIITNKLIEKEQWLDIAAGTTQQIRERVQSSGSKQTMADAVINYVTVEEKIDACIKEQMAAKQDILNVIEQLNAIEYDILHKVYVQNITLCDVAIIYDKTYSWITTMHGNALKSVQKILDERKDD